MLNIAISKLERHTKFNIVFVGGSSDGETREVERIPPIVNMQPPRLAIDTARGDEPCTGGGVERYKRVDLSLDIQRTISNTAAIIYVHEALTDAEVLNIILTHYIKDANK